MSQCVPSWDLDENPVPQPRAALKDNSNSTSLTPHHVPMLDYEVAELTWENGQLSMHGLGPWRVANKPQPTWDKPGAGGTLESIVNQATSLPHCKTAACVPNEDLVPWFDHHHKVTKAPAVSTTVSVDALVPALRRDQQTSHMPEGVQTCVVGSCSGNNTFDNYRDSVAPKCSRVTRAAVVPSQQEWSSSFTGRDSQQFTLDTYERDKGLYGFTSTSMGSLENTSSGQQGTKTTTADEDDSVCHMRHKKRETGNEEGKKPGGNSSLLTKRSRTTAIHNQSERKRRDKINQRMKTLQKLVPNCSKTDKASMLDEVIEYLKQLQAQVSMINRLNMSSMMLPMTLQQQLQLSMMGATAPMGATALMGMPGMNLGMGMGIGGAMDINSICRPNLAGMSPIFNPGAFMPLASWDRSGDRLSIPGSVGLDPMSLSIPGSVGLDPMSAFLTCQSQPMTMDAYSRMVGLYQQFNQTSHPPATNR